MMTHCPLEEWLDALDARYRLGCMTDHTYQEERKRIVVQYRRELNANRYGTSGRSKLLTTYVCSWNQPNRAGAIIRPGSLRNAQDFLARGNLLLAHDPKNVIATPIDIDEDAHGTHVAAEWGKSTLAATCAW